MTLDEPEFALATRTRLGNPEVRACVAEAVGAGPTAWLAADPARAAALLGH